MNSATNLYLENHKNTYGAYENDIYCISLGDLVDENYLSYPIKDSRGKELSLDSYIKVEIKARPKLNFEYVESCTEINTTPGIPNEPDLDPGVNSEAPQIEFTGSNYIPDTATSFDALDGVLITDDRTPRSEIKVTITGEVALGIVGKYPIVYEAIDGDSNVTTKVRIIEVLKTQYVFSYTGVYQEFKVPFNGIYKVELWGASGGDVSSRTGGKGAYVSGFITWKENEIFYIYVGEKGSDGTQSENRNPEQSFNSGGRGANTTVTLPLQNTSAYVSASGGGATDIRTYIDSTGLWNDFDSLKSRIMIASGGGGAGYRDGGSGGTLQGISSPNSSGAGGGLLGATGGTQISGGITPSGTTTGNSDFYRGNNGFYALGGFGVSYAHPGGGGGGGYYGGAAGGSGGNNVGGSGGGGGSSYISGYPQCNAISKDSTDGNIIHTGEANHYSGYVFTEPAMKAGNDPTVPTHDGTGTMTGNNGNGYAKITIVSFGEISS